MVSVIYKVKVKLLSPINSESKSLRINTFAFFLGLWLCGLLVSGELFLWNRDKDLLKTAAAAPDVVKIITAVQGVYCINTTV